MQYAIKHTDPQKQVSDCLILGIFTDRKLSSAAKQLDSQSGGQISKLLQHGDLSDDCGQTLLLLDLPKVAAKRILLVSCGKESDFNELIFRKVLTKSIQALKQTGAKDAVSYLLDLPLKGRDIHWKVRQAFTSAADLFYTFDNFKSQKKKPATKLQKLIFNIATPSELKSAERAADEADAIISGMTLTKNLGNAPANVCTPTYIAQHAQQLAKEQNKIKVQILEEKDMKKLGMGALLAVSSGSHQPAKLIVLEYYGGAKTKKPIALVGKGVTFDSGGISIKPSAAMDEMKFDMCGAASVLGTFKAVAELKLPVNLIGVVPATENLPGGNAAKPGDIATTLSGQTIEILNTDAEGRLILADALTYCERFKPEVVIDIATLTGAVVVSLGSIASGVMGNHEPLLKALQAAADKSYDRIWPFPLWEDYQEQISSNVADMANIGAGGGKVITAACLLARFAKKFHWAHLDIAGTAWTKDKTATGRPVPLLVQYLLDCCGKK